MAKYTKQQLLEVNSAMKHILAEEMDRRLIDRSILTIRNFCEDLGDKVSPDEQMEIYTAVAEFLQKRVLQIKRTIV